MIDDNKNLPAFVVITGQVHFDKNVTDKEVRVYGYVSALTNSKGYCYATNKYLAETFEVSEKTIQRAVNSLVEKGYLKSVIIRDDEGMVVERRLFLTFPAPKENADKPHNDGMDKFVHRGMDKNVQYNNINNNNYLGSFSNSPNTSEANTSPKENAVENKQVKLKPTRKKLKVSEDSTYFRVVSLYNEMADMKCKANTKTFVKNIDTILEDYSEEDIINMLKFKYETEYMKGKTEWFTLSTMLRPSNFGNQYEYMQRWLKTKKTCANNNTQVSPTTKTYYIINPNTNTVMTTPVKPNGTYFLSKEDAEAAIK